MRKKCFTIETRLEISQFPMEYLETGYGETEPPVSCGLEIDSGKEMDTKPVKYAFTDDVSD